MNTIVKRFSSKFVTHYSSWMIGIFVLSLYSTSTIAFANQKKLSHFNPTAKLAKMDKKPIFTKIVFKNQKIMRKFAISFHHALLEINYESLYAIADLTLNEQNKLDDFDISYQQAVQWSERYWKFQGQLTLTKTGKQLAGIVGFECYATVEETLQQGLDLSVAYPGLSEWIDIGDSWKKENGLSGYDLMVLKITNKEILETKPILFIHSSMHAREYSPAALSLEFAHRLLEDYDSNADTRWLVDYHEVHILFQMNPDGRKIAEGGVLQRKNTNENHCSTGDVGVDLNRNFAYFWDYTNGSGSSGNECNQTFRGISAESEPETQAVSNYIRSLFPDVRGDNEDDAAPVETTGMHIDIHSYSELVLWPYGHKEGASPNDSGFVALGNKLAWYNDYTPQQSIGLYATDGTSDDVSYGELGIAAFTFELGTSFFQDCSTYDNTIKPDNLKALQYAAKASAMPYLLAKGPEVSSISLNGTENGITISQGTTINLVTTLKINQTKLVQAGRTISKAEYSIDSPIWLDTTTKIEITDNDGALTAESETFNISINTSNFDAGEHILYVRGYNQNQQVGVPSAVFINVGENNSPTPNLVFTCTHLSCNYDASGSSDSDGNITNYLWDFNGEETSTSISGNINFASASNKTINLTVTDDSNNTALSTLVITVVEPSEADEASSSGGGSINLFVFILLIIIREKTSKKIVKF